MIISLIFIVLLTGVVVTFSVSAAYERRTSKSFSDKVQADFYAKMGTQLAVDRLSSAVEKAGTNGFLVSAPGLIAATVPGSTAAATPETTIWKLSSGSAAGVTHDLSVDLNLQGITSGRGLIDGNPGTTLPVKWAYVRKDGTQIFDPSDVPTIASDDPNPLVGRYAFWVDDESSRLNLNALTSSQAPQNTPTDHPSRLHLAAPSPLLEDGFIPMRNARVSRIFNTVEEALAVASSDDAKEELRNYSSAGTVYNHSPFLNRFGGPRIVLTTQRSRLTAAQLLNHDPMNGNFAFLDILQTDNTDPGALGNISSEKVEKLFDVLYAYFGKTAAQWGLITTDSGNFHSRRLSPTKYTEKQAAQIILNLIEYVRCVESPQSVVLPLRGAFITSTGKFVYHVSGNGTTGSYGSNGILGNSRRLHLVEMGVWLDANVTSELRNGVTVYFYPGVVKVRIYLPETVANPVDIASGNFNLYYSVYPRVAGEFTGLAGDVNISPANIVDSTTTPGVMQPGEYRTLRLPISAIVSGAASPRPTRISLRTAVRNSAAVGTPIAYDLAPVQQAQGISPWDADYPMDPASVPESDIGSLSTNDPVIGQSRTDWKHNSANTFTTQDLPKASTLGDPVPASFSATDPSPDSDADGNYTDHSTRPPAPANTTNNPLGRVMSVGEIGRVHSGGSGTTAGTPWRTLRLQPRKGVVNAMMPDWVLMELFTAPFQTETPANEKLLRPSDRNIAGKVNLNSVPAPFTASQFPRKEPLGAVLKFAMPTLSYAELDTLIDNIRNKRMADSTVIGNGFNFGTQKLRDENLYSMPSEVLEVLGIADRGESGEDDVARLIGHLTTQGNVFSVYTVGQRITRLSSGVIKVNAETRQRVVVENDANGGFTPLSITDLNF